MHDTLIIGAGLSGLQAALALQSSPTHPSTLILEAKSRVGGKSHSQQRPDGKGIQELGACWVNDTNQSEVWKWCEKLGLTSVVQNVKGRVAWEDEDGGTGWFEFGGLPEFDAEIVSNIASLRDAVEAASLDPATFKHLRRQELSDMSFEQFCHSLGAEGKALLTARTWTRGTLGQDPDEISALAFLEVARGGGGIVQLRYDGKDGAQYLRLREGTSAIPTGMAALLESGTLELNTVVTDVTKRDKVYEVKTSTGEVYKAKKVIVSVPSTVYKDINFDPPLPEWKQAHVSSTKYGTYVKYICLFKTPWWRDQGACGLIQSFRGPINHCRDTSVDEDENYALTCFITSGPAKEWLKLGDQDRQRAVLEQLARLFQVGLKMLEEQFLGKIVSEWHEDAYAGWGCPFSVPPPGSIAGQFEDGEIVGKAGDGLVFVGTELTNEWRGYMEGALRSGRRGAQQVLEGLQGLRDGIPFHKSSLSSVAEMLVRYQGGSRIEGVLGEVVEVLSEVMRHIMITAEAIYDGGR